MPYRTVPKRRQQKTYRSRQAEYVLFCCPTALVIEQVGRLPPRFDEALLNR